MAETEFTRVHIDSLSTKVAALDLSPVERTLLSTLVALATENIDRRLTDRPLDLSEGRHAVVSYEQLPDLESGLANAFTPGIAIPYGYYHGVGVNHPP